jgi:hypothetical protein
MLSTAKLAGSLSLPPLKPTAHQGYDPDSQMQAAYTVCMGSFAVSDQGSQMKHTTQHLLFSTHVPVALHTPVVLLTVHAVPSGAGTVPHVPLAAEQFRLTIQGVGGGHMHVLHALVLLPVLYVPTGQAEQARACPRRMVGLLVLLGLQEGGRWELRVAS